MQSVQTHGGLAGCGWGAVGCQALGKRVWGRKNSVLKSFVAGRITAFEELTGGLHSSRSQAEGRVRKNSGDRMAGT